MSCILVIEDDQTIREALMTGLTERDHVVVGAPNGIAGLEAILTTTPDLVLLDLGLPDVDGFTVITMVRALDAGADDYVLKPFGIEQVAARIRALLRRGGRAQTDDPIRIGDLSIHARSRIAVLADERLQLARKEFDLLLALAQRSGEVVTKRELLAEVWQQAYGGSDRTVDVHLSWLRRKLGETAAAPRYLLSVRGAGIRLVDATGVIP